MPKLERALLWTAFLACACSGQRADLDALLSPADSPPVSQRPETATASLAPASTDGPAPGAEPREPDAADAIDVGDALPNPIPAADARAAACRELVAARPKGTDTADDADALVDGARALFLAADLRMQRGLVELLRADPPQDFAVLLDAGDRLPQRTKGEVLALCEEGAAFAKRALAVKPDDAGARTYYALNLSLVAWAKGAARAVVQGMGPRVSKAIASAVESDEGFEAMAPLRLEARFRTQAPWPYRDRDAARALLVRAVAAAPTPVHHLFLGDVLAIQDDVEAARAE